MVLKDKTLFPHKLTYLNTGLTPREVGLIDCHYLSEADDPPYPYSGKGCRG